MEIKREIGVVFTLLTAGAGWVISETNWNESYLLTIPVMVSLFSVFMMPAHPGSHPVNVISGHFVASLVGLILYVSGESHFVVQLVGIAVAIGWMSMLNVLHLPAAANPYLIMLSGENFLSFMFLFLVGSALLIAIDWLLHVSSFGGSRSRSRYQVGGQSCL